MLVVLGAPSSPFDAGSLGITIARSWALRGEAPVFIDADTSGSRLAERYGTATRGEFSPAVRGLPSLMTARVELTASQMSEHCYLLDSEGDSLWALFGPRHPRGGVLAARWLGSHAERLSRLDRARPIVVASSLVVDGAPLAPLIEAAPVVVVSASVRTADDGQALAQQCRQAGLMGFERFQRLLLVDDSTPFSEEQLFELTGLRSAGRPSQIADDRLLRGHGTRRERSTLSALETIGWRLLGLRQLCIDESDEHGSLAAVGALSAGADGLGLPRDHTFAHSRTDDRHGDANGRPGTLHGGIAATLSPADPAG